MNAKYKKDDMVVLSEILGNEVFRITNVRFDVDKNPIYTGMNDERYTLLRDCEIAGLLDVEPA